MKNNESVSTSGFARGLLATTCLTVACGATAVAGTITEGVGPAPTDFDNSPKGYLLPVGTTVVNGYIGALPDEAGFDNQDWFEFQGLTPGASYTFHAAYSPLGLRSESGNGESNVFTDLFTDSGAILGEGSIEGLGKTITGVVPEDGFLGVAMFSEGFTGPFAELGIPRGGSFYQVTLDTTESVPEPATLLPVGLALAGALAWRRKRRA